jgi:hypothetical protein
MDEAGLPDTGWEEARPWETNPHLRRDAEANRGGLLDFLSKMAGALCIFGWPVGVPLVVGVPLGAAVYVLATRDLARMKAGGMDHRRRRMTERARAVAALAVVIGAPFLLAWGLVSAALLLGWLY